MTARERLDRRLRWIVGASYAGIGLFLAGVILGILFWQQPVLPVVIPGLAVAVIAGMAGYCGCLRCPRCQANLGAPLMQEVRRAAPQRVRFCPYCGADLDAELPGEGDGDGL
jgi:hypothetical protein